MKLLFGSDHAGIHLRKKLVEWADRQGHLTEVFGAPSEEPFDYPDAADEVCQALLAGRGDLGVLICGSGIGISIRANRHRGIHAALCCTPEMAELARLHNYANIVCLGERLTQPDLAEAILARFIETGEDRQDRRERRVAKTDGPTDLN
ncbi:MAG TPA: RpiB/LacA/LacB family sugar-phosphate isomerase [Fimbriimonadaceae bacterium]|nr:RpiB/LacA/LacB family sugar-phosphate isomerase [Fimbriimonadaceae bacterium]HRJ34207.1 RpiB/LacA/LacB family sugar-phosphate isomerase [Fimbriimonadaceae bacterium]